MKYNTPPFERHPITYQNENRRVALLEARIVELKHEGISQDAQKIIRRHKQTIREILATR